MVAPTTAPPSPVKYVKTPSGVMKLNPGYKKWKESFATTAQNQPAAASGQTLTRFPLPVVTTLADHQALNRAATAAVLGNKTDHPTTTPLPLAASTTKTLALLREPTTCRAAGLTPATMAGTLSNFMAQYDVPMGLWNKLLVLDSFDQLEFIIDDSGSMLLPSNEEEDDAARQATTRWHEAQLRLHDMLAMVAHVPFQGEVVISFLNRSDRIVERRNGRAPALWLEEFITLVQAVFATPPTGSTPALESLQASFARQQHRRVARYFFGDGQPNGGRAAELQITAMIRDRPDPQSNPITFISCSDQSDQVEWMKDAEEVAPYCAESDDFAEEAREVLRDQGPGLPYTRGFYLISQLVAAMYPDDLDAMDESIPLTKHTLDDLLGVQHNAATYRHYFDCFVDAQQNRVLVDEDIANVWGYPPQPSDDLKQSYDWESHYDAFLTTPGVANTIPAVRKFQSKLRWIHQDTEQRKEQAVIARREVVASLSPRKSSRKSYSASNAADAERLRKEADCSIM